MDFSDLFSPFIIVLRETVEASILIALMLDVLRRSGERTLVRYVWLGVITALCCSVLAGVILWALIDSLPRLYEEVAEASLMIVTALLILWMLWWMARYHASIRSALSEKVEDHRRRQSWLGLSCLAFVTVLREAMETVFFLLTLDGPRITIFTVWCSVAAGVIVGILLTAFFHCRVFKKFSLRTFFWCTTCILALIAIDLLIDGGLDLLELFA